MKLLSDILYWFLFKTLMTLKIFNQSWNQDLPFSARHTHSFVFVWCHWVSFNQSWNLNQAFSTNHSHLLFCPFDVTGFSRVVCTIQPQNAEWWGLAHRGQTSQFRGVSPRQSPQKFRGGNVGIGNRFHYKRLGVLCHSRSRRYPWCRRGAFVLGTS
jgi:hypothetical protein